MDALHATILGLPAYVWLIVVGLGFVNEVIRAAKFTRALSIWQGLWRFFLWLPVFGRVLDRLPWAGDVARYFAGIPASPPPIPPSAMLALLSVFLAVPGCPSCTQTQISTARSWITAADRANGATARLGKLKVKECVDEVVRLADADEVLEAQVQQGACAKMATAFGLALESSVAATGTAAPIVDAAEKGNPLAALAAVVQVSAAVKKMVEVHAEHGVRVPVALPPDPEVR